MACIVAMKLHLSGVLSCKSRCFRWIFCRHEPHEPTERDPGMWRKGVDRAMGVSAQPPSLHWHNDQALGSGQFSCG